MRGLILKRSASLAVGSVAAVCAMFVTARAVPMNLPCAEAAFLTEYRTAMTRMMTEMDVSPRGDVDRDFAMTMIPHHQAAIDMARSELRYGRNEYLRRIAQEIVVEQQQEIVVMRQALDLPRPGETAAADQPAHKSAGVALCQVEHGQQ